VVRFADRIAYLNHDLDDGVRAGVIGWDDVPDEINRKLGRKHSERIATLVMGVVDQSRGASKVEMTPEILAAMDTLRKFLFERVYLTPLLGDDRERAERIIHELFVHYTARPGDLPQEFARIPGDVPTRVSDFIAGMTDGYAIRTHAALTGEAAAPAWDESKDVD
jgi:dGTPase